MKRLTLALLVLPLVLGACNQDGEQANEQKSPEELKALIDVMHDSITKLSENKQEVKSLHKIELINRHLDFYRAYPKDAYAAECLDKVHMIYSGMGAHYQSTLFADTLLEMYPDYENRPMILESQASTWDIFLEPRDTNKVRKYYEVLLNENPNMDAEKKAGIEKRLKHLDLDFDTYINQVIMADFQADTKVVKE